MKMMDFISTFFRMAFVSIEIYFCYIKIINYKSNIIKNVLIICISLCIAIGYIVVTNFCYPLETIIFLYIIYGIVLKRIINHDLNYIAYIIAFVFSYIIYLISVIISGVILLIFLSKVNESNPISLFIIPIISILMLNYIFSIKRLKNGLKFIENMVVDKNIIIFSVMLIGITMIVFGLFQKKNNNIINIGLVSGIIFAGVSLTIFLKSQITKHYKTRMRDRTIEIQKTEIDEKDRIIENVKSENLKLATAVHKYNNRLSALENAAKRAIELDNKTEFAEEISNILKEAKEISEGFSKEVEINQNKTLPLTNIIGIDNMLKYMQEEANKNNIEFNLNINESINSLVENIIPRDKLEIMIGDHIKDAIIAINASNNSYRSILVILGIVENCYEFSIYDTGIEFEIETLLKLGKEQVTTHKDTGGSGIGFMTTFETLKDSKASLQIEEYNTQTTNYTKCVTIRFDGKNQYRIYSYRAEQIRAKNGEKSIIIKNLN